MNNPPTTPTPTDLDELLNYLGYGNLYTKPSKAQAKRQIQALIQAEIVKAREEEWQKIHTKYQKGDIKGQYMILEAVRRVGKNIKFRVRCLKCQGVMFRYANKFGLSHKDCVDVDTTRLLD